MPVKKQSSAYLDWLAVNKAKREMEEAAKARKAARLAAIAALPQDSAPRTVRTVRSYHGTMRVEQRGCCPVSARPDKRWFMEV